MDDSCAVCADTLEWVGYGSCGHREVCSTCVVRLRFVLNDRCCCICKTENPVVFITKAMGDYTRVITDFSVFPSEATEGKAGGYWYHEGSLAYFDDVDHYRMIKATCRLSCSVCDKEEQGSDATARKRTKFRNIEQLKGHLFHQHKLFMCSLCLEGRKVFICEQKLYTRPQLNQHISTGDSEVDGSESERGGFMGHPMCEFCKNPFYGDNELYTHMSMEHYTCHICQRQHPGQYDYYRNYDDLEIHFRQEHFLCEDEACLEKKFIVFQSEAEMKRHNSLEHGGHMSRAKRNAALQIPTSFRYRRTNEQDQRRGRGRGRERGFHVDQFGIEFSHGTSNADSRARDSSFDLGEASLSTSFTSLESLNINPNPEPPRSSSHTQSSRSTPIIEESSFPPLSDWEPPEPSSRYAQALHTSRNTAHLGEESFPPLPGAEKSIKPKAVQGSKGLGKNSLAARLRRSKGSVAIHSSASSAWFRPSENHEIGSSRSASSQIKPATNPGISSSSSPVSHPRAGANQGSSSPATAWSRPSENHDVGSSRSASSQIKPATNPGIASSSSPISHSRSGANQGSSSLATTQVKLMRENGLTSTVPVQHSPWNLTVVNSMRHSASAPNLIEGGNRALPTSSQTLPEVKEVQNANKSLVERIRAGLGMDGDRFAAFKNISAEYRQGLINTWEYLSYVEQFGLSHLVLELAQLCPDAQKQKELIDAYNANLRGKVPREDDSGSAVISKEGKKGKGKGEGKCVDRGDSSSATDALTDSILDTVRKLQSNLKSQEDEEVETLSKDGYRTANTKPSPSARKAYADSSGSRESPANSTSSNQNVGDGGSKQKKTSKFHRIRLGDGSAAALLDPSRLNASPERPERESGSGLQEGLPVRGVWRNGGGLRLVANSEKSSSK